MCLPHSLVTLADRLEVDVEVRGALRRSTHIHIHFGHRAALIAHGGSTAKQKPGKNSQNGFKKSMSVNVCGAIGLKVCRSLIV